MKTITLNPGERLAAGQLPRQGVLPVAIMQSAQAIVDDVRERGDVALREYCKKFDGVDVDDFRVDPKLMDEAIQAVDPAFIEALKKAAAQIREFHEREVEQSWFTSRADFGREGYSRFCRGRVCTGRPRPVPLDGAHGLHSGEGRWRKARGYGYPAAKRRRHFAVHARCRESCGRR